MLKNKMIDEANLKSMKDREKIFNMQTLLKPYAPCKHNNNDEFRYSSHSLI